MLYMLQIKHHNLSGANGSVLLYKPFKNNIVYRSNIHLATCQKPIHLPFCFIILYSCPRIPYSWRVQFGQPKGHLPQAALRHIPSPIRISYNWAAQITVQFGEPVEWGLQGCPNWTRYALFDCSKSRIYNKMKSSGWCGIWMFDVSFVRTWGLKMSWAKNAVKTLRFYDFCQNTVAKNPFQSLA